VTRFLARIVRDQRGATAVEFALLGPVMVTLMLAVLQIGIALWSYNSMRSIASDIARYAVVNYQGANKLSTSQIQTYARSTAISTPYGLTDANLSITVVTATTQRVSNATELTMTINYSVPTIASIIGMGNIPMTYTRPIFVMQ
jgi:Flp pilus assembly protein TadG